MSLAEARLAVFYDEQSFSMYDLAEAARDFCELVWVVDVSQVQDSVYLRLLERLGTVLDASGLRPADLAVRLRELEVQGVAAYSDGMLQPAAAAASEAGLPFHSPEVAGRLRDKFLQRQALRAAGVPCPAFAMLPVGASASDIDHVVSLVNLPVVVKPTRGASSRDVVVVATAAALRQQLAARVEDVVVEDYLPDPVASATSPVGGPIDRAAADFVSVETVVAQGDIRHLFISGRLPLVDPLRESGGYLPSDVPAETADAVYAMATAAVTALGVTQGFLHTEVKLTPDGPRIVEINGRIGGGIPALVAETGGPDLLRWSFMLALGVTLPNSIPDRIGVGFWLWEQAPTWARSVTGVGGLDAVAALEGVHHVTARLRPGDAVDWHEGGQAYVYRVDGWVRDHRTLWERRRQIYDTAAISYT